MRTQYWHIVKAQWKAGHYWWLPRQGLKYLLSSLSPLVKKPLTGPILGTVVATYRCNNRCFMCESLSKAREAKQHGHHELDTEAMKHVLDEFAALGTTGVGFTGGEPLLRSDIFTLLEHSKTRGMITHLNTNGFLLTPDRIRRLLEIGVDSINISLDGATAATHEAVRGVPGGFQRILDGLKFLLEERKHVRQPVTVNIVSVISQNNLHEIGDLVHLAMSQQVDGIGFLPLHGFYAAFNQDRTNVMSDAHWQETIENTIDSLIAMKRAGQSIENSLRYLRLFTRCFRGGPLPIACYAGYNSYVVDCYGDIFPCVPWNNWNRAVQNIRHVSLKDFWFSQEYDHIRKTQVNSCRECYWNCHTEMNLLFHPFFRI